MEDKPGGKGSDGPLAKAVSPSNRDEKATKEGAPGSRLSMKRTSRMSDVLEGALAEHGALSIKAVSPVEASEARRSVRMPLGKPRTPPHDACVDFEPNVFLPDMCAKCSKKKGAHGARDGKLEEGVNVSVKASQALHSNNAGQDAPAPSKSPKARSPKASAAPDAKSGKPKSMQSKHGYDDADLFSSSDDDDDNEIKTLGRVARDADLSDADRQLAPVSRMMNRLRTAKEIETSQANVKSGERANSPSLRLAAVTPSKITPELKEELTDIILRRRRRLYGLPSPSAADAKSAADVEDGPLSAIAPLVPDLPPDAEPIRERLRITEPQALQSRSRGNSRASKVQTLPARFDPKAAQAQFEEDGGDEKVGEAKSASSRLSKAAKATDADGPMSEERVRSLRRPNRLPSSTPAPSSPPNPLAAALDDLPSSTSRPASAPRPLSVSISSADNSPQGARDKAGSPHVGLKTTSRPSSPSVTIAMETPHPLKRTPKGQNTASPQAMAAAAAGAALRQASGHALDEKAAGGGEKGRRHRPSQVSREFKDEVVSYLDSASMGLEGEGEGEGTGKLFHDPASPSNGGARRKGQPRAGREGGDGLSVEEMEDGPLMAAPLVIKAPTKTPTGEEEEGDGEGRHSRHVSLEIGEPPPTKARLCMWLRRPLVAHAQNIRTLCRRIRPSAGQVLMPSRFIMHLPDFEHKAVLLAEGQSALDPRSSLTYQIYVGPGPKGDSVAALKRLPRDGGGETVYQLLYCDEKKGTWGETAVFRFAPGFDDKHSCRQVGVWLTKRAEAWVGSDAKDTLSNAIDQSNGEPIRNVTKLTQRDPQYNGQRRQLELPLAFGYDAPRGGFEASIKTVQLSEPGSSASSPPVLQFFRDSRAEGKSRDVFAMDAGAPLSLVQAFAFAIANMECEAKGGKVCAVESHQLGQPAPPPEPASSLGVTDGDGPSSARATPITDLYSSFIRHVATPLQQAWASPGRGDRYKENPDPASDNDATVEGSNPMRAHHQEEGRGHRGDSCEEARPARTPAEEEAWRMLNSLEETQSGGGLVGDPAVSGAYDSNTTSLAQLREAWNRGLLSLHLDQYRPAELRKLLESPPLTLVDLFLLSKTLFYHTPTHARLCLAYLMLSMLAELYPLSPTYNTSLAMASLYITLHIKDFKESYLLTYFFLHATSLLFDLNWVVTTYSGSFMGRLKYMCVALVAINMALKLGIMVGSLRSTPPGVSVLRFVGSYLKLLLPPALGASRAGLLVEVYGRLILLTWMHFLGGLAFLVAFVVMTIRFPFEDDFQTVLFQIPLSVVVLFKGISALTVSGALFRNMQLTPCLGMFGCLSCCYEWAVVKESKHARKYGVDSPPVLINSEWTKLVLLIKGVDVVVAGFLWAILLGNYDQLLVLSQYSVQQMCATIFAMSILLDVWGLVLGCAVGWLYSVHKYRTSLTDRRSEREEREAEEREGRGQLNVGPGYMNTRRWSVDSDLEEEDVDGARAVNVDDLNSTSLFQPGAAYESPRRPVRHADSIPPSPQQGYYEDEPSAPLPLTFLDAYSFSPSDFSQLWDTLPPLIGFDCYVSYVPTLTEVTSHLHRSCFFVIASGTTGSVSKVYACARAQDAKGRDVSFLAELVLDSEDYTMGTTFKCDDVERIGDFMAMLSLREVVGDYSAIPDGPHTINAV